MNCRRRPRLALLALAVTAGALVPVMGPRAAQADPVLCERALSSESAKFTRSATLALQRCEDAKVIGTVPPATDCSTDGGVVNAIGRAQAKLARKVAIRCGGQDHTCGTDDDESLVSIGWGAWRGMVHDRASRRLAMLAQAMRSTRIVTPSNRVSGVRASRSTPDCPRSPGDIVTCLACVGQAAAGQTVALDYGSLNSAQFGTDSPENFCQRSIGQASTKFFLDRLKALQKCWDGRLKGHHSNACPDPGDGKAVTRIAHAEESKVSRICRACGGADHQCGGGDDLALGQVGFAAQCSDVTAPSDGSCSATITDMSGVVTCVDCDATFASDCMADLGVSALVPYPQDCSPTTPPDFCPAPVVPAIDCTRPSMVFPYMSIFTCRSWYRELTDFPATDRHR